MLTKTVYMTEKQNPENGFKQKKKKKKKKCGIYCTKFQYLKNLKSVFVDVLSL